MRGKGVGKVLLTMALPLSLATGWSAAAQAQGTVTVQCPPGYGFSPGQDEEGFSAKSCVYLDEAKRQELEASEKAQQKTVRCPDGYAYEERSVERSLERDRGTDSSDSEKDAANEAAQEAGDPLNAHGRCVPIDQALTQPPLACPPGYQVVQELPEKGAGMDSGMDAGSGGAQDGAEASNESGQINPEEPPPIYCAPMNEGLQTD